MIVINSRNEIGFAIIDFPKQLGKTTMWAALEIYFGNKLI